MRIVTLMENTTQDSALIAEHGLSLYIECCGKKILFDAGTTDGFLHNAKKLGVDLSQVDMAVLSHGHKDHSGGLMAFLQCNDHAPIYVSAHAFSGHFNAAGENITPDSALLDSGRLIFVTEPVTLAPDLLLDCPVGELGQEPLDTAGLLMWENGTLQPENFRHEQYLLVRENGKKVVFSGCSHRGIVNIARYYQPDVLIGGFHFMKREPESLAPEAKALLELPTQYYTGHCTGQAQYDWLKTQMTDRLSYLSTGTAIEL